MSTTPEPTLSEGSSRLSFGRLSVRLVAGAFAAALRLLDALPRRAPRTKSDLKILLTGTFYSDAWIATHLLPLAGARNCAQVFMVASRPVPAIPKVVPVYPPNWLRAVAGGSGARIVCFVLLALRMRPDVIGGFHLLLNGLFAVALARIVGSRSLYFCGGGQREVEGGGYNTENRLFRRLGSPDPLVERWLIAAARRFDLTVTMGQSGRDYFLAARPEGRVIVVPGGFDDVVFSPNPEQPKTHDLVLVGRLSPVKRVERLVRALAELKAEGMRLTAIVVGDGPSRAELEQEAKDLGVAEQIDFVGYRNDVAAWLQRARVFTLTSESEGLSQAMIQGMLCGLPAVVTNVGDLRDLVQPGINGILVEEPHEPNLRDAFRELFRRPDQIAAMGRAARERAQQLSIDNVSREWERYLAGDA